VRGVFQDSLVFEIALLEPEIPPNTGNIIRLSSNVGCPLHLIEPLGFSLEERRLRRAGLDYHEWATLHRHADWEAFLANAAPRRLLAFSTKGQRSFADFRYESGDVLLFGRETRGLPEAVLASPRVDAVLRLPMQRNSRSLNLSNAVAVAAFEAWRQLGYAGAYWP
jgi:tRNA (cytidine/uridine-2'-O-)-methyltransferase